MRPAQAMGRTIPYFLNPSFLVARKEFIDFADSKKNESETWRNVADGLGEYSWLELIEAAKEFCATVNSTCPPDEQLTLFDCGLLDVHQNVNCLFFEIMESLLDPNSSSEECVLQGGECWELFNPEDKKKKNLGFLVKTISILIQLIRKTYRMRRDENRNAHRKRQLLRKSVKIADAEATREDHEAVADDDGFDQDFVAYPNAVLWRHWYSTYRQMAADMSHGDCQVNPGLKPIRLPRNIWANGDWHIAILDGSVGQREGVNMLLYELITPAASMAREVQGVGLSPFRDMYKADGADSKCEMKLPVSGLSPSWFLPYVDGKRVLYRNKMPNYVDISPALCAVILALITLDKADESSFNDEVCKRFKWLYHFALSLAPMSKPVT